MESLKTEVSENNILYQDFAFQGLKNEHHSKLYPKETGKKKVDILKRYSGSEERRESSWVQKEDKTYDSETHSLDMPEERQDLIEHE